MRKFLLRILFMLCLVFIMLPGTTHKASAMMLADADINGLEYDNLQDALDNVGEGQTIKLLKNIDLVSYIATTNNNSFTLDLNGKTLTSPANDSAIYNVIGETLTITDNSGTNSGKIIGGGSSDGAIYLDSGNSLILTCGTIQNNSEPAIVNASYGNIIIPNNTSYQWRTSSTGAFTFYMAGYSWAQAYSWTSSDYVEIIPYTPSASSNPTASVTTVNKSSATQTSIDFTLTNSPTYAGGTWKVYTDGTGSTPASGVTAANTGNTLTLTHETNIPAAIYYVAVTEIGKLESERLALTVGAYVAPVTYNVWVGGVQVSSANKDGIPGTSTGTVAYNPDTNILTLSGATITVAYKYDSANNYYANIYAESPINIVLTGSNTITGVSGSGIYSSGIYCKEALNIFGNGSLNVSGGAGGASFGIYSVKDVTISSGTITATSGGYGTSTSIGISGATVTISGGTVITTAGQGYFAYGICANNGVNILNGIVNADATSSNYMAAGICSDTLVISGGVVSATAHGDNYVFGISSEDSLAITGGTVTATTNGSLSGNCAINTTAFSHPNGIVMANTINDSTGLITYKTADIASYRYIKYEPTSATPVTNVATIAKTSATQSDVIFTLTNNPAYTNGQTWKVYTSDTASTPDPGVTASNTGNTLTLHATDTDITAGIYYVSVTEGVMPESTRLALTVGAYVPPATVPGTPTIVGAENYNGQINVYFTAPASNGGAAISSYTVTSSPGGITATGTSSPITVTGLTLGTSYTFTVTATNSVGMGSASSATGALTYSKIPTVTTNPATNITTSSATLNGSVNANAASTEYKFQYGPTTSYGSETEWQNIGSGINANSVSCEMTGLTQNTVYRYRVVARNSYGTILGSEGSFATLAKVSQLNLTGKLTPPATGATPVTTLASDFQYTGSVSWSTTPSKFLGSTVYTATVTLTVEPGYSFTGVSQNSFSYTEATSVTNEAGSGNTMIVTIVFPATAPRTLQSISIDEYPNTVTYYIGDTLSTAGLIVKATYNDGTYDNNFTAYTVDKTGPLDIVDGVVKITATDDSHITNTFSITVSLPTQPIAGTVTVSGGNKFNQTLTASYTPSDSDNGTLSYQWKRDGSNIGTNSNTYTLVEADIEHTITCEVSSSHRTNSVTSSPGVTIVRADGPAVTNVAAVNCTNSSNNDGKLTGVTTDMEYKKSDAASYTQGTGSDVTGLTNGTYLVHVKATTTHNAGADSTFTVGAYVPGALTGSVTISGSTTFGQTLTATYTPGNNTGTLSYQWKRGSENIGTNMNTYTLVEADVSKSITCEVRSTEQSGFVVSGATSLVSKANGPAVIGATTVGCTNASNNDGKLTGVTTAMEYKKSDAASYTSGTGSDITGLTNGTYLVHVKATTTHNAGADSTFTIGAYVPDALTGSVTISGSTTFGQTLTAAYASGNNNGTLSYQWKRGSENIGTNMNTYTLVEADVSKSITCEVRSTEQSGFVVSGATSQVSKANGPAVIGATTVGCTNASNNDGKLTGVTTTMEYKKSDAASYNSGTGSDITGLTNGTYLVHVKATTTHNEGADSTFTIGAYVPPAPDNGNNNTNTTPKTEGKIEKDQKQDEKAPIANLNDSTQDLKSKIFSEEEQTQVAAGKDAKVILKIEDISASVSAEDKKQIEKKLAAEQQNAANTSLLFVDISLYKKIGDDTETRVTQTSGKISISIEVPESMWSTENGVNRTYRVVRIHNGVTEILEGTYDPATHLFTFETDQFSTYALTYQDANSVTPEPIPTYNDFNHLRLKVNSYKTSQKLSYAKVYGADGYIIYGGKCGEEFIELAEVSADTIRYTVKELKQGTYYKYQVKAYKLVDGEQVIIATSKVAHSVTESKKYADPTKVTVDTTSVILKVGESQTVNCQVVMPVAKKLKQHTATIRYEISDKAIAIINSKGKITAKSKGICYVYAYAQNGVYQKIKVMVE